MILSNYNWVDYKTGDTKAEVDELCPQIQYEKIYLCLLYTSLKTINGKKYAFDQDGRMLYGWVAADSAERITSDDGWNAAADMYYFGDENDGSMATNWQKLTVYDLSLIHICSIICSSSVSYRCLHDFLRSCWMAGREWYMGLL